MANHFVEFSEVLPNLRADEEAWLREQMTKIYVFDDREYPADDLPEDLDLAEADWYGPRFLRDLDDESDDLRGFEYKFRDAESQADGSSWGRHLWFYAEQQGNPESVALLVQKFLARFRPDDCWEFSCACGCNKLCVGAFGGDGYFVTAGGIQSASDLLERVKQKFRMRQHRESGQQTATLIVDVDYDPAITNPESLAAAMDTLLKTALSTPGVLEDYGNPVVGEFLAPEPHEAYVVATKHNGISYSLDRFVSDTPIERERLVAYYETAEDFDWERDSIVIMDLTEPTDLDAWENNDLATIREELDSP